MNFYLISKLRQLRMKKPAIVFFLCLGSAIVSGQETDLKEMSAVNVTVTEAGNGEPVQMATVYIVPDGDTLVTAFTFTDKRGIASLKGFPAGKYTVNVQLLGFKPYAEEFTFEPLIFRTIPVKLEENVEELEGASITEMGDLVTVKGDTLIYNATSFRTASNANLGDLLKKMPGIEVDRGRVRVNGEPVKRITVEGKTFFFDDQAKALENLPAVIVNQIRVIDKENHGRFGMSRKEKEMDVRLKEEYKEAWFGKVSAEGGVSVKDKASDRFGDGTMGLYNAKLYAQFYGDDDNFTLLGGGNNVNANQLSRGASGLSDIASAGVNYNTSRIPGMDTDAAVSYDFRRDNSRSESHRTSFLSSGERLETSRSQTNNDIGHSAKADFMVKPQMFSSFLTEGISINGTFQYNRKKTSNESNSSMTDTAGEELNGSKSYTAGNSDDFNAKVNVRGKYYLDKARKHHISFEGNIGYDGTRGNSEESSVTRYMSSSDSRSLLYDDKSDAIQLSGYADYSGKISENWRISSELSADFSTSEENRNAENAADFSRNDWYSRYSTDRSISLKQTVKASYGIELGERKRFIAGFGLGVYEDNTEHHSRAFGTENNSNSLWQVSAGPDLNVSFLDKTWDCGFRTSGRSVAPPQGDAISTMLDVSNPVDISTGNIYLKTGYHQDLNLYVSQGRIRSGKNYVSMRLAGSVDVNEITCASWYDASAVRYSIPVNSRRPRYNASLNITYIQPLDKKKRLNLTVTPKAFFSTGSMYIAEGTLDGMDMEEFDYAEMMSRLYGDADGSEFYSGRSGFIENRTTNLSWSVNAGLKYELKQWSLRGGASVNNTRAGYSAYPDSKVDNWRYNAYAEALWRNRSGWEVEGRFDFNGYSGFSYGYNSPDWLLNLQIAKDIGAFTISLSAYDILGSAKSFSHIASAEYVEDTYRNNPGRCILIGLSYNFGKWSFLKQSRMEMMEKRNNL